MGRKHFLLVCATLSWFIFMIVTAQTVSRSVQIPRTRFTCQGRAAGYYADIETGCQVYHMCDGLGRQFSYTCPNTTLFQQRMLICDHWYMVNCSMSERDYGANLLIGQRDKPFVSEEEMRLRTPRPDILSVPPNSNYFDGLREAESKFPIHPGNSIVGIADSISSNDNSGLDSAKQNYRPPTSWSTGTGGRPTKKPFNFNDNLQDPANQDSITGAASQRPRPTIQPTLPDKPFVSNNRVVTPPSQELRPPVTESSEEFEIDARIKNDDAVFNFIKRFDPNSPDSHKTAMTKTEIVNINDQLPAGQASSEEERTPRKNKNTGNSFNRVESNKKGFVEESKFNTVNTKPAPTEPTTLNTQNTNRIPEPERELVPPKSDFSDQPLTTSGPPVYYEWKWAVPAFDLEPPKVNNSNTNKTEVPQARKVGTNPFRAVTRSTPVAEDLTPSPVNTEYNISSYFVPDYVFPLDNAHPGYESDDARTSFQVQVSRPGRASYGENPDCPQCHPAYLKPGTCEPCIVRR